MRILADYEIEFVSGGLVDNRSWYDRLCDALKAMADWISAHSSSGSGGNQVPTLSGSDLGQMQRDCLASGGNFTLTQLSGSAGASFRVAEANGSYSYFNLSCTQD